MLCIFKLVTVFCAFAFVSVSGQTCCQCQSTASVAYESASALDGAFIASLLSAQLQSSAGLEGVVVSPSLQTSHSIHGTPTVHTRHHNVTSHAPSAHGMDAAMGMGMGMGTVHSPPSLHAGPATLHQVATSHEATPHAPMAMAKGSFVSILTIQFLSDCENNTPNLSAFQDSEITFTPTVGDATCESVDSITACGDTGEECVNGQCEFPATPTPLPPTPTPTPATPTPTPATPTPTPATPTPTPATPTPIVTPPPTPTPATPTPTPATPTPIVTPPPTPTPATPTPIVTPPPTPTPDTCFAGSTEFILEGQSEPVQLNQLTLGSRVKCVNSAGQIDYCTVYGFGTALSGHYEFTKIQTTSHSIELTPAHIVYKTAAAVDYSSDSVVPANSGVKASKVNVGDNLVIIDASGHVTVEAVTAILEDVSTESGSFVALLVDDTKGMGKPLTNNILSSAYTSTMCIMYDGKLCHYSNANLYTSFDLETTPGVGLTAEQYRDTFEWETQHHPWIVTMRELLEQQTAEGNVPDLPGLLAAFQDMVDSNAVVTEQMIIDAALASFQ